MAVRDWSVFLKEMRRQLELKQDSLAALLGVSQSTVSKWEKGVSEPTIAYQKSIFAYYREATGDRYTDAFLGAFEHWLVDGIVTNSSAKTLVVTKKLANHFGLRREEYFYLHVNEVFEHENPEFGDLVRDEGFFDGKVTRVEFCNGMRLRDSDDDFKIFMGQSYPYVGDVGFLMVSVGSFVSSEDKERLWPHSDKNVALVKHA